MLEAVKAGEWWSLLVTPDPLSTVPGIWPNQSSPLDFIHLLLFFPLRHLVRKWRWRISGSGDVSAWIFEVSSPGVPPGVAVGLGRPGWGGASPAQPAAGASAGRSFRFVGDGAVIPRKGCELGSAGFVYNAASDRQVKELPVLVLTVRWVWVCSLVCACVMHLNETFLRSTRYAMQVFGILLDLSTEHPEVLYQHSWNNLVSIPRNYEKDICADGNYTIISNPALDSTWHSGSTGYTWLDINSWIYLT